MAISKERVKERVCSACRNPIFQIRTEVFGTSDMYGQASFELARQVVRVDVRYACSFCGIQFEPTETGEVGVPVK